MGFEKRRNGVKQVFTTGLAREGFFLRLDFERRKCNRSDLQDKWQSCYVYINPFHDLFLSSLPVVRVFTTEPEPYAVVREIGELIDVCTPPFDTSLSGYTCNFHSYPISSEINIKPNFCFHPPFVNSLIFKNHIQTARK